METRFKVLFDGELAGDIDVEEAVERLRTTFGLSDAEASKLLSDGRPHVLASGLDEETAEKVRAALANAGLAARVETMEAPADGTPPPGEEAGGPRADTSATAGGDLRSRPPQAGHGGPRKVPAGHGLSWIARGFWHFRSAPLPWVLVTAAFIAISVVVGLVPGIGGLAVSLLSPILTGGAMYIAREQDQGRDVRVEHLFAGFSERGGKLALVGVLYLAGVILIILAAALILSTAMAPVLSTMDPELLQAPQPELLYETMGPTLMLGMLGASLLLIPLIMSVLFAPALVMLEGMRATGAMKQSFAGCLKNILPFLLYGLIATVLVFLGALPFGLGLLVAWPILMCAIYAAYQDIYRHRA